MSTEPKKQHEHGSVRLFTAYDRALITASRENLIVTFDFFGLDEKAIEATIVSVDKFFVEIEIDGERVWINKSMIAMTRIPKVEPHA